MCIASEEAQKDLPTSDKPVSAKKVKTSSAKASKAQPPGPPQSPGLSELSVRLEKMTIEDIETSGFHTKASVAYDPEHAYSILERKQDEPVQNMSATVVRYSEAELEEFREIILKKLEVAKSELLYLQKSLARYGEDQKRTHNMIEDGSMNADQDALVRTSKRQREFIDHLEKALLRIKNKTYGVCRVTGKLIAKDRLRSVPHATLSLEAKLVQITSQKQSS